VVKNEDDFVFVLEESFLNQNEKLQRKEMCLISNI
jgi:hypothetical protein